MGLPARPIRYTDGLGDPSCERCTCDLLLLNEYAFFDLLRATLGETGV